MLPLISQGSLQKWISVEQCYWYVQKQTKSEKQKRKQNNYSGSIKLIILTYFNFFTQVAVYFQEK